MKSLLFLVAVALIIGPGCSKKTKKETKVAEDRAFREEPGLAQNEEKGPEPEKKKPAGKREPEAQAPARKIKYTAELKVIVPSLEKARKELDKAIAARPQAYVA